jgi:hypothetical protein
LLSWTVHWPGQWSRYQRFRKIGPGHHAAALEGFHREIWKYFRHPVKTKERIYDSLEESPDAAGSAQARCQHAQHYIMSPEDSNFLRKHNPLMSGKLALNLQFLRTELRLGFANHYSGLFAMCHLYNALRQLGYLDEPWEALDTLISMHIKPLFLGDLPTGSATSMVNRAFLAFGCAPEVIRAHNSEQSEGREKNVLRALNKRTKGKGKLTLTPTMANVADYMHDRQPLRRTLLRIDAEMVAQQPPATKRTNTKSFLDDGDPIAFLERVRDHIAHFDQYFSMDYMEIMRICAGLFAKMETDGVRRIYEVCGKKDEHKGGFSLNELANVSVATRPGKTVPRVQLAVDAAAVLKEYVSGKMDVKDVYIDHIRDNAGDLKAHI